jgi:hypothetical protein
MSLSSSGGAAASDDGGGGSPVMMALITDAWLAAPNGLRPVTIS